MTAFLNMMVARRDAAKILLLIACVLGCTPLLAAGPKADQTRLPADVKTFIERRDGCDHFRGEDSPDPSRRAQIDDELQRLCTGTDRELARLKRAYAKNQAVQAALDEYEITIEEGN